MPAGSRFGSVELASFGPHRVLSGEAAVTFEFAVCESKKKRSKMANFFLNAFTFLQLVQRAYVQADVTGTAAGRGQSSSIENRSLFKFTRNVIFNGSRVKPHSPMTNLL